MNVHGANTRGRLDIETGPKRTSWRVISALSAVRTDCALNVARNCLMDMGM